MEKVTILCKHMLTGAVCQRPEARDVARKLRLASSLKGFIGPIQDLNFAAKNLETDPRTLSR